MVPLPFAIATAQAPAVTELSATMRGGIAGARAVSVYTMEQRRSIVQQLLGRATPPVLSATVSLTPNAPYADGDARLSFWKPSFVLGTPGGGEAGINFWGVHVEGHVNVAFTPAATKQHVLDCRVLSAGPVTYSVYSGPGAVPKAQGDVALKDNHMIMVVAASAPGVPVSVELWPTPVTEKLGFLGCDIATID